MVTHQKISAFPFRVPRLFVCFYAFKLISFPLIRSFFCFFVVFFFYVERANIFGVAIL